MAWKKPKYSLKEVSQTFNLKDLLGREPTDAEKQRFVSDAVNLIATRTQSGQDINGNEFSSYTKQYANKKGVSRNSVNLTLSERMLRSMTGEPQRKNLVKVFVDGSTEVKKSYNHNVGDTLPKRTFFGLKEEEAREIAQSISETSNRTLGQLLDEIGGLRGELLDQN